MISKIRLWIRSLYTQTQRWGRSDHCLRDLLLITVFSTTLFPLPVEAFLIAIVIAAPHRWWRAAAVGTLGSTVGAIFWYLLGRYLLTKALLLLSFVAPNSNLEQIKTVVLKEGMVYLCVAAFTPGLFRVGMVAAGVTGFSLLYCIVAMVSGRGTRFILETGMMRIFGRKLAPFLEKYFDLLTLAVGLVVVAVIVIVKAFG